ncbi:MAG TPA: hypothetical protein VFA58_00020, partial [Chthoniobacterales bacterium]|nr:hypothetical protein [Chthoniobacterales bacterium]
MKTITALVMGCSLAIAGAVFAQTAETQESPAAKGGKHGQKSSQETTGETKGKSNAGETRETHGAKGRAASTESNANATQPTTSDTGGAQG